jgi:hypothetical protein
MIRLGFALLFLLQGDSPEQAFASVKKAVTEKNFAALLDSIAPTDRKELEDATKRELELFAKPEGAESLKEAAAMLGVKEEDLRKMSGREFMVRMMTRMAELQKDQFEREMGKFLEGAIAEKKVEGDWCVLKVKRKDKVEEAELVREGGKWYLSMAPQQRASNQRNAAASLKILATAQADFRANDRDGDKVNNFWVKDVAGLYGILAGGEAIQLIDIETAVADRTAGKGTYASVKLALPKAGHHFAALKRYREGGKAVDYDDGKGRNPSRFGFVAWPAEYPRGGRMTFIVSEENTVFQKDTGGKPVEEWPGDPRKEGWTPLD